MGHVHDPRGGSHRSTISEACGDAQVDVAALAAGRTHTPNGQATANLISLQGNGFARAGARSMRWKVAGLDQLE
jgi:hypothetical protein